MRRLGILSLGVVAPVLFRVISSCMRSQPTRCIAPAFFAYGIPVYVHFYHFYVNFWFIISNLHPPVVVAFGHALPWGGGPCSFSCYFFVCVRSQPTNCIAPALFACGVVAPVFFCFISASTPQPININYQLHRAGFIRL
jgi:hypothetical protein